MNDYVSKPVTPDILADTLSRWLPGDSHNTGTESVQSSKGSIEDTDHLAIFDSGEFLGRVMNDPHLARRVITGFLNDMPGQILRLIEIADTKDYDMLAKQAHKIKGAAANVSALRLKDAAIKIEHSVKTEDYENLSDQIRRIEHEFITFKNTV